VPGDASNLCFQAAAALQEHFRTNRGVCIVLDKQIPVGAGLGGGSSDAACVLRHLPEFWGYAAAHADLQRLALSLGSDVPYFLESGTALGRGRGEILRYFWLDIPYTIVLCNPNIHVSTARAYSKIRPRGTDRLPDLVSILRRGMHDPRILREELVNDFEGQVISEFPAVGAVLEGMMQDGAVFARMSGSGSSVFGLFPGVDAAGRSAESLRALGYRVFLTPPRFTPPPQ
jgi:4-diphosphocytidyl-2-C-methyl-D-erythritol kinase